MNPILKRNVTKRDNRHLLDIFQNILEPEGAILEEKELMMIDEHLSAR